MFSKPASRDDACMAIEELWLQLQVITMHMRAKDKRFEDAAFV